jgi:peptidoglycan/xylan/chitin deacetylase (PgdA/CDA1 family)
VLGIVCSDTDLAIAEEFFELFKTPWERYRKGRRYDVVIAMEIELQVDATLLVSYGTGEVSTPNPLGARVCCADVVVPIYCELRKFKAAGEVLLRVEGDGDVAGIRIAEGNTQVVRLGFNLFKEVEYLLKTGQPPENAMTPTLDIHISMLRSWILQAGLGLIEVPPVPAGYGLIACLTHDVDFAGIRHHKLDHSVWGFIYRALFGSLQRVLTRQMPWDDLRKNWLAVSSLPLVYLGLCRDFWLEFDRYFELEAGLKSTFFLIPFKGRAGHKVVARNAKRRAARYDITDIQESVREALKNGNEIGLHGIDAWHSETMARQEAARITQATGKTELGVRVHWLCFDSHTPEILDKAGFDYDSTFGFNEVIGYRAGTSRVFRPLGVSHLLELPLHIQDVAMFRPSAMGLSEERAQDACNIILDTVAELGGVVTVLWHMGSLSPERLWSRFYIYLLQELSRRSAWFATASEVTQWFRMRRALIFEEVSWDENGLRLVIEGPEEQPVQKLFFRIQLPQGGGRYIDVPWSGKRVIRLSAAEMLTMNGTTSDEFLNV